MEVIGVTSGRLPSVDRPASFKAVFLTFDGLRESKVRDASGSPCRARMQHGCGDCVGGHEILALAQFPG